MNAIDKQCFPPFTNEKKRNDDLLKKLYGVLPKMKKKEFIHFIFESLSKFYVHKRTELHFNWNRESKLSDFQVIKQFLFTTVLESE